jgi:hypothetical protein
MTTLRVDGVKGAIKELRRLDPELRKTFNKNVREIVKPAVVSAQQKYRAEPYPSGTARNWQQSGRQKYPLDGNKAARATKAEINTSKKNTSTILIVNRNAGAAIFEFANTGSLGMAFRSRNGLPARTLWPAVNAQMPRIIDKMTELIQEVEREISSTIRGK